MVGPSTSIKSRISKVTSHDTSCSIHSSFNGRTSHNRFKLDLPRKRHRETLRSHSIELVRVFRDEGESARTADRPEFQEMFKFLASNKHRINLVLVWKFDRFARNQAEHHILRGSLKKIGIRLVSITQQLPEDSTGALVEGIMATVSEYESLVIGERSKRGTIEARRGGKLTFKAPVGLRNRTYGTGKNAVKTVEHDEKRAHFIRQMYEMVAGELHSYKEIIEHINTLGFTMPESGKPLTKQTLDRILKNRVYTGYIRIDKDEGYQKAEFDPIISKELYETVQLIRKRKKGNRKKTNLRLNPDFPLKRFVKCANCGAKTTGSPTVSKGKKYPYYHIPKHKGEKDCPVFSVKAEILESDFLTLLKRLKPTKGFKRVFKEAVAEVWREKQKTSLQAISVLITDADQIRRRLKKLQDMWYDSDPDLDRETFRSERKRLQDELDKVNYDLRTLQDRIVDLDVLLDYALDVLEDASKLWLNADVEQRYKIQETLFPDGLGYSPDEGFRNPVNSRAFSICDLLNAPESQVVPLLISIWNPFIEWMRQIASMQGKGVA